jgi:hypothetical protein
MDVEEIEWFGVGWIVFGSGLRGKWRAFVNLLMKLSTCHKVRGVVCIVEVPLAFHD